MCTFYVIAMLSLDFPYSRIACITCVRNICDLSSTWYNLLQFRYVIPCAGTNLLSAQNEMHTAIGADDVAHLADVQSECGLFERLLHLTLQTAGSAPIPYTSVSQRTFPNAPRSPPFLADEQSECTVASCLNFSGSPLISCWYPRRISMASAFERVMFACHPVKHYSDLAHV